MKKEKIIDSLENRKAKILFDLCENDKIYMPEIIAQMVMELRGLTKILRLLNNGEV